MLGQDVDDRSDRGGHHVRADAAANRRAIIGAAWALFAERGDEVPMRAVAQAAGVGIATLYRHFATPQDLLVGLLDEAFTQVTAIAQAQDDVWELDPDRAWTSLVRDLADLRPGALAYGLAPRVQASPSARERVEPIRDEAVAALGAALGHARAAGLVDPAVTVERFFAGLALITRPSPTPMAAVIPDQVGWMVGIYLRGLRP